MSIRLAPTHDEVVLDDNGQLVAFRTGLASGAGTSVIAAQPDPLGRVDQTVTTDQGQLAARLAAARQEQERVAAARLGLVPARTRDEMAYPIEWLPELNRRAS